MQYSLQEGQHFCVPSPALLLLSGKSALASSACCALSCCPAFTHCLAPLAVPSMSLEKKKTNRTHSVWTLFSAALADFRSLVGEPCLSSGLRLWAQCLLTLLSLLWAGSSPHTKPPCLSHTVTAVMCAEFGPAWLMMEAVAMTELMLGMALLRSTHGFVAALQGHLVRCSIGAELGASWLWLGQWCVRAGHCMG